MENSEECLDCPDLGIVRWSRGHSTSESLVLPSTEFAKKGGVPGLKGDAIVISASSFALRRCTLCRGLLSGIIPDYWWEDYCQSANGYFCYEESADGDGRHLGMTTSCRFRGKEVRGSGDGAAEYSWYKLHVVSTWVPSTSQAVVLLFDFEASVAEDLSSRLLHGITLGQLRHPLWPYPFLLERLLVWQSMSVWGMRDLVRATEKRRDVSGPGPDTDSPSYFPRLHDLSRHAIHITETLEVAAATIEDMLAYRFEDIETNAARTHSDSAQSSSASSSPARSDAIRNRLMFHKTLARNLLLRSQSNKERLQNEISLAFNMVTQRDARVSVEIGRAAQADGAAMKTIAFVTLAFLPATFVCAFFSMSFFDFSPPPGEASHVSDRFWIYWAVTLPLMIFTPAAWYVWQRFFPARPVGSGTAASGCRKGTKPEVRNDEDEQTNKVASMPSRGVHKMIELMKLSRQKVSTSGPSSFGA